MAYGDTPRAKRGFHIVCNSPVVLGFVVLCVAVQVAATLTGGASTDVLFSTAPYGSVTDPLTYLRCFTHAIGHSGWDHLMNNMSYILLLGPLLEEKYGSRTILEVMCITAFVTGIIHLLFFPGVSLRGASGIVFAFILLSSVTSIREGEIPLTFVLVAFIYLGQQVVDGIFVRDNISQLGHIIGGVVGALSGFLLSGESGRKTQSGYGLA